jgi:hypothetical protein
MKEVKDFLWVPDRTEISNGTLPAPTDRLGAAAAKTPRFATAAVAMTLIGIFSTALPAQPAASLSEQLSQRYSTTQVGADGTVIQAGAVLILRQLILANPTHGDIYWPSSYKKGRISLPAFFAKSGVSQVRPLNTYLIPGDKLYLTNIEMKESAIAFRLQTCAAAVSRPDPSAIYRAELTFEFQKGSVNIGNLGQIEGTIGEVLAVAPSSYRSPVSTSQGTQPPLPPPPQATQQTVDIVHAGQTVEEVKVLLGQPDKIDSVGDKVTYSYTGLKITFANGKISDVQ